MWRFEPTEDSTNGTRVLRAKSSGAYSVPAIWDDFPSGELPSGYTYSTGSFICRSLSCSKPSNVETWTAKYSTLPWSGSDLRPEDEPQDLRVSTETMILENEGAASGVKSDSGSVPLDKPVYITFPIADYSQTKVFDTFAAAITGISVGQMGKVIEVGSTQDGFWLYLGADITEYRDSDGDIKAKAVRQYAYRKIFHKGNSYGWEYVWSPSDGGFILTDPRAYAFDVAGNFPDTMPF